MRCPIKVFASEIAESESLRPRRTTHTGVDHPAASPQSPGGYTPSPSNPGDRVPLANTSNQCSSLAAADSDDVSAQLVTAGLSQRDPFAIVKHLVQEVGRERYGRCTLPYCLERAVQLLIAVGYEVQCTLIEPEQTATGRLGSRSINQRSSTISVISDLTRLDLLRMSTFSQKQLRRSILNLLDLPDIGDILNSLFADAENDTTLGAVDLRIGTVSMDLLALAFAQLALSDSNPGSAGMRGAFLELSSILVEDYAGEPTLNLALALFLQHICALNISTSNRSRALIGQAVQVSHDIGIAKRHSEGRSLAALRFYVLLCFADQ